MSEVTEARERLEKWASNLTGTKGDARKVLDYLKEVEAERDASLIAHERVIARHDGNEAREEALRQVIREHLEPAEAEKLIADAHTSIHPLTGVVDEKNAD